MKSIQEILTHFQGVQRRGDGCYQCRCPAHPDKEPSLSITEKNGKVLIHCHAGCSTADILTAAGLTFEDLGGNEKESSTREQLERYFKMPLADIYEYTDEKGNYLYSKGRFTTIKDGVKDKTMRYFVDDKGSGKIKQFSKGNIQPVLYNLKSLLRADKSEPVYIVEGEKDVETLKRYGYTATTAGGVNDWREEYARFFKDLTVIILPDNDSPGLKLKDRIIKDISPYVSSVKWSLTSSEDKGDVTDWFNEGHTKEEFEKLVSSSEEDELTVSSLENEEIKETEWLISGFLPKGQVTVLAGDGGSGKTTIWCALAAAVSAGRCSFFETEIAEAFPERKPLKVLFFSSEDSLNETLLPRLDRNGADRRNLKTIKIQDKRFEKIKFGSRYLEKLVEKERPALMIFDPLQSYVDPKIKMGDRNAMRSCLNPLIGLGEKYGVMSLIVVHANKQSGVYGRKRIADSADIWDLARSVLMVGTTEEKGVRYISQEKSNYGVIQDTVLFSIHDGEIKVEGHTVKHDREFIQEADYTKYQAPKREEAKEFILDYLKDGEKEVSELDGMAKAVGISGRTLTRAKAELRESGIAKYRNEGYGKDKKFYISLIASKNMA